MIKSNFLLRLERLLKISIFFFFIFFLKCLFISTPETDFEFLIKDKKVPSPQPTSKISLFLVIFLN